MQYDAEGAVGPLPGGVSADAIETRLAILERDPCEESLDGLWRRLPPQADQVLPLDLTRGVHQAMGQRAVGREQQQPGGVYIEPPDTDPAPPAGRGQALEDRRPPLRVAAGRDLAHGLVIKE